LEEYEDTAQAAKDLGSGKLDVSVAVIAPKRCAELYGLEILEESIQDLKFNFTAFIAGRK
jgi:prephenate dehydratase